MVQCTQHGTHRPYPNNPTQARIQDFLKGGVQGLLKGHSQRAPPEWLTLGEGSFTVEVKDFDDQGGGSNPPNPPSGSAPATERHVCALL